MITIYFPKDWDTSQMGYWLEARGYNLKVWYLNTDAGASNACWFMHMSRVVTGRYKCSSPNIQNL